MGSRLERALYFLRNFGCLLGRGEFCFGQEYAAGEALELGDFAQWAQSRIDLKIHDPRLAIANGILNRRQRFIRLAQPGVRDGDLIIADPFTRSRRDCRLLRTSRARSGCPALPYK